MNFYTVRDHVLWAIPYPMRYLVGWLAYRKQETNFHGQGTGRFTPDEIAEFRLEIWEAVDALLTASRSKAMDSRKDRPFWVLGGSEPTEADTTVFGIINSVLVCAA